MTESGRFSFLRRWFAEPLRHGSCLLFRQLKRSGHSIWIYTSSGRTPFQIRFWLFLHGIHVDGVVNETRHKRALAERRFSRTPSKYPPAFGIDLHVDNSAGVREEGDQHGFRVLVVDPLDHQWTQRVLEAVGEGAVAAQGRQIDPVGFASTG